MQVVTERKEIIFRNDITYTNADGVEITRPLYKIGLSHKNTDGSYSQGSMLCKFPKDTNLESKTLIYIEQAWIDFYFKEGIKSNGDKYKETIPYIFINKFKTIDEAINEGKPDLENKEINQDDPYKDFSEEVVINPDDLPF